MAATSDEKMESLLYSFEQIYEDFKNGIFEIQSLRSTLNAEMKKREAMATTSEIFKKENERLKRLCTDSLNNLAEQLGCRTKCQSLKEQLCRAINECINKEEEHKKSVELLKIDWANKVADLEAQNRDILLEKAKCEATINCLHQDLAAHKIQIHTLAKRLECICFELEGKYHLEIQDLKDCLLVEQEEKRELYRKLQELEKELAISKTKFVEQQQDLAWLQHVETLKLKIMKLRKDNEILRRKLSHLEG